MTDYNYILLALAVMAAVTFGLRATPFVILRKARGNRLLDFFGSAMPPGIMLILVVYSISSVNFADYPFGMPALISMAGVVVIHHLWRKALLSIVLGTAIHMVLLQVF